MLVSSSRLLTRQAACRWASRQATAASSSRRLLSTTAKNAARSSGIITGAMMASAMTVALVYNDQYSHVTLNAVRLPFSGDVLTVGTPTKEPQTGILFPPLCNAMSLVGVGVRIKYLFVKVYAVGTYMDPVAMMAVKKGSTADIEKALLDPTYPRTIRIVMNRALSIEKYTAAIVESIEPRLNGKELES